MRTFNNSLIVTEATFNNARFITFPKWSAPVPVPRYVAAAGVHFQGTTYPLSYLKYYRYLIGDSKLSWIQNFSHTDSEP
jgi:hypothetical protein